MQDISCIHYLLPEKRDPDILSKLRRQKTFKFLLIMTARISVPFAIVSHRILNYLPLT